MMSPRFRAPAATEKGRGAGHGQDDGVVGGQGDRDEPEQHPDHEGVDLRGSADVRIVDRPYQRHAARHVLDRIVEDDGDWRERQEDQDDEWLRGNS